MSSSMTTLVAASPTTFLFMHEQPTMRGYANSQTSKRSVKDYGIREISRQQWESMKPLIQRIYVEEDKPFPYLEQVLRDEYGFETTKRKFSRKIAEWGFRKNIPCNERRNILQTLSLNTSEKPPELMDRRLKPSKLKNWQRRYKEERDHVVPRQEEMQQPKIQEGQASQPPESSINLQDQSGKEKEPQRIHPGLSFRSLHEDLNIWDPAPMLCDEIECEICNDPWPFDWSSVEIPGSPGLTRFFEALEIENTHVDALSLETCNANEPVYLDEQEIRKLVSKDNKDKEHLVLDLQHGRNIMNQRKTRSKSPQYPWRDIESVFCGYSASPLNEIYVFQPAGKTKKRATIVKVSTWNALYEEKSQVETTLGKFKQQFQPHHPGIVTLMETLSELYYRQNKDKKAEILLRTVVGIHSQTLGSTHPRTLQTLQKLINTLIGQGQYTAAQTLHSDLCSKISKCLHSEHITAIQAMEVQALLSGALGDYAQDEYLHRQALQIRLSNYGPRDKQTLLSMARLGLSLGLQGRWEGEQLLRIVVQLHLEDTKNIEEDAGRVMANLAYVCWVRNEHGDGCTLASTALQRFGPVLGNEHPETLQAKVALARNVSKAGRLSESERIFREVVTAESELGGETKALGLSNSTVGLAEVLAMRKCYDEASQWYEVIFEAELEGYGPEHQYTRDTCHRLGNCYLKQERYLDALQLYCRMLSRVRSSSNSTHPYLAELECWIEWLEARIMDSEITDAIMNDGGTAALQNRLMRTVEWGEAGN